MKTKLFCLVTLFASFRLVSAAPPLPAPDPTALKWDAESKQCVPKPGEVDLAFTFVCTNVSSYEVAINSLTTSCGCTVAQLPVTPYKLEPGSNVTINVAMNVAGKYGLVTKGVTVLSTAGTNSLLVNANIPMPAKQAETK